MKFAILLAILLIMPSIPISNAKIFAEVAVNNNAESASINDILFEMWKNNGEFIFVTMPYQNEFANERMKDYNATYPDIFIDGGYKVVNGMDGLSDAINDCERREKKIDIHLKAKWLECPCERGLRIEVTLKSMEKYEGILRIYIVEVNSRWKNIYGGRYHFSFLEFADVENVSIEGKEYYTSVIWDTKQHYPDIYEHNHDNIAVIAAIFSKEWHTGYAEPPNKKPFKAHYVDGAAIFMPPDVPPYVSIRYPREGFLYLFGREMLRIGKTVIIGGINVEVDTWDDKGIEKIELYQDGKFVGEIGNNFVWRGKGHHSIEVTAYDGSHEASDSIRALLL